METPKYLTTFIAVLFVQIGIGIWTPSIQVFIYQATCVVLQSKFIRTIKEIEPYSPATINETMRQLSPYQQKGYKKLLNLTERVETINEPMVNCSFLSPAGQDMLQEVSSENVVIAKVLQAIPCLLLNILFGGWIDRMGFIRIPVMICSLGGTLAMIALALTTLFKAQPLLSFWTDSFFFGLLGPRGIVVAALQANTTLVTPPEERTNRLGQLFALKFLGLALGALILALVTAFLELWVVYVFAALFFFGDFLIALTCLPDHAESELAEIVENAKDPLMQKMLAVAHPKNFTSSLALLFRYRPNNKRSYLLATFFAVCIEMTAQGAEETVFYLFVMRRPLDWNSTEFSIILTYEYGMSVVLCVLAIPLLVKVLKMGDPSITVAFAMGKSFGLIYYSMAETTPAVFLAMTYVSFHAVINSSLHSTMSKLLEPEEQGRCFSIIYAAEILFNLIGVAIFSQIYYAGLNTNPFNGGIAFIAMAGFLVIVAGLAFYVDMMADLPVTDEKEAAPVQKKYGSLPSDPGQEYGQMQLQEQPSNGYDRLKSDFTDGLTTESDS